MKQSRKIAISSMLCLIPALVATQALAASGPKIKSVLVISIDGMHSQDLSKWVQAHPKSTLAGLAATGVNYTNAFSTKPSDSIPATVGIFTGGSPANAGMYYDDAYNRAWFAPTDLTCTATPGAAIDLKQGINAAPLDGSGGVNPAKMPRRLLNGVCAPVLPHDMLRLNTIFEVVRSAGLRTAYSEKRPAYDFLNGPSGTGVQDLYTPEIACYPFNPLTGACNNALLSPTTTQAFDQLRVNSILNEINHRNSTGTAQAPVPALFGMNFQAVNSAKKASPSSGYADLQGNPDDILLGALTYVDTAIGSMVFALREEGLLNNTAIVITAKHGESPVGNTRTIVSTGAIASALTAAIPTKKITLKTSALIWLTDQTQTATAVAALKASTTLAPNLSAVLSFGSTGFPLADPSSDPAPPDIIVVMNDGVNFEPSPITVFAEHGGFGENETHVPLLVSNPKWTRLTQSSTVSTKQIAPTVLSLLGLDPLALQAVHLEGTESLSDVLVQ